MKTVGIPNADRLILDLCGGTGSWSAPYKEAGYQVINVTLPEYDVRTYQPPENVYGILAAPPCTMFSIARTTAKTPRDMPGGMELVLACLKIIWACQYRTTNEVQQKPPLKFWALENPYGMLNWFLGHPTFTFQPYEFGDMYSKKTCLWGYFNSPNKIYQAPLPGVGNFDTLGWKDKKTRQAIRSITPRGFALAFYEANK